MHTLGHGQVPKGPGTMLIQDLWLLLAPSPAPSLWSPGPWLLFPQASLSNIIQALWLCSLLASGLALVSCSQLLSRSSCLGSLFSLLFLSCSSLTPISLLMAWSVCILADASGWILPCSYDKILSLIPRTCRVLIFIQTSVHGTCMVGQKHTTRNSRYFVTLLIADCWQHRSSLLPGLSCYNILTPILTPVTL